MHPAIRGAFAGATASAPMTAAMLALHTFLPPSQRYELPPEQLTARVARRAGADAVADERRLRLPATALAHFGYGALMGAAYGLLAGALPGNAVARGLLWGVAVWTGSYAGWLPAVGLRRPPQEHPPEREALMVAAHLVYGLGTAALDAELRRPAR
jgi:uncharacterized membrane protein YagU involved in acid resistance